MHVSQTGDLERIRHVRMAGECDSLGKVDSEALQNRQTSKPSRKMHITGLPSQCQVLQDLTDIERLSSKGMG
jgi:hypothetical protein